MLIELKSELKKFGNPEKAKFLSGFFKTGKGQYGEGDIFLGIAVPKTREIAKKYAEINFKGVEELLNSKIHEERLASLMILVEKYKKDDAQGKKLIIEFYLKNAKKINNWDFRNSAE